MICLKDGVFFGLPVNSLIIAGYKDIQGWFTEPVSTFLSLFQICEFIRFLVLFVFLRNLLQAHVSELFCCTIEQVNVYISVNSVYVPHVCMLPKGPFPLVFQV